MVSAGGRSDRQYQDLPPCGVDFGLSACICGVTSTPHELSPYDSMRLSKITQDLTRTRAHHLLGLAEQIVQKEPASTISQLTALATGEISVLGLTSTKSI